MYYDIFFDAFAHVLLKVLFDITFKYAKLMLYGAPIMIADCLK